MDPLHELLEQWWREESPVRKRILVDQFFTELNTRAGRLASVVGRTLRIGDFGTDEIWAECQVRVFNIMNSGDDERINKLRVISNWNAWLFCTLKRLGIDELKNSTLKDLSPNDDDQDEYEDELNEDAPPKKRVKVHVDVHIGQGVDLENMESPWNLPDELERKRLDEMIVKKCREELTKIPNEMQQQAYMLYLESYSQKEMAEMLGVPVSTINNWISRIGDRIKKAVRQYCIDEDIL